MVIDGDQVKAGLRDGHVDLNNGGFVFEDGGDGVAGLKPLGPKPVDQLIGAAEELAIGDPLTVLSDDGEVLRVALCDVPKTQVFHSCFPLE